MADGTTCDAPTTLSYLRAVTNFMESWLSGNEQKTLVWLTVLENRPAPSDIFRPAVRRLRKAYEWRPDKSLRKNVPFKEGIAMLLEAEKEFRSEFSLRLQMLQLQHYLEELLPHLLAAERENARKVPKNGFSAPLSARIQAFCHAVVDKKTEEIESINDISKMEDLIRLQHAALQTLSAGERLTKAEVDEIKQLRKDLGLRGKS